MICRSVFHYSGYHNAIRHTVAAWTKLERQGPNSPKADGNDPRSGSSICVAGEKG